MLSKRFVMQRHSSMPLEPRGVLADYDRASGTLTVWSSTQIVHGVRSMLVETLDLPAGKIIVKTGDVGGGFGLKASVYTEEVIIPAVSRLVGRSVKWIEDRYEHLAAVSHTRRSCRTRYRDGRGRDVQGYARPVHGQWRRVLEQPLHDLRRHDRQRVAHARALHLGRGPLGGGRR